MEKSHKAKYISPIDVSEAKLTAWQEIVDTMADIIGIPAGLIMRLNEPDIEVLVSSKGQDNPYHPGDKESVWESGLYCETVLRSRDKLLVPNALADENKQLTDYISEVKTLRGILPICMHCKKIRDDKGYWNQVEAYIQKNSEASFSHGICRECVEKYYPDLNL